MLYLKNQAKSTKKNRFVFEISANTLEQMASSGAAPKSLAERSGKTAVNLAEQFSEKNNIKVNIQVAFDKDPEKVFKQLGEKAEVINAKLSAQTIAENFIAALENGENLEKIWAYLEQQNCETAAIVRGLLCFFAGEVNINEISIAKFLKPREIKSGGEGTLNGTYVEMRQKLITDSMQALAMIKKELPERPPQQTA